MKKAITFAAGSFFFVAFLPVVLPLLLLLVLSCLCAVEEAVPLTAVASFLDVLTRVDRRGLASVVSSPKSTALRLGIA
jgi:hypothetical protein